MSERHSEAPAAAANLRVPQAKNYQENASGPLEIWGSVGCIEKKIRHRVGQKLTSAGFGAVLRTCALPETLAQTSTASFTRARALRSKIKHANNCLWAQTTPAIKSCGTSDDVHENLDPSGVQTVVSMC